MRIFHLNCGTDCPLGGALFDGRSVGPLGRIVCHCLLIETDAHGLVLVDTGYGLRDVAHPHHRPDPRISVPWRMMLNIRLHERETAIRQIEALGYAAGDVRHIIATHLDFDHAGGLEDFPNATVHVMQREYDDATGPRAGVVARNRWRPSQLNEVQRWQGYGAQGDSWFGFDAVRDLVGLPPEILMVPLPGHTWGHAGVAVRQDDGRWLLHAGDAYFYRGEMRQARRRCTPGLRAYQRLMEVDATARLDNQQRLRRLSVERRDAVTVTCTHDPVELERLQAGRPL
ncbi:glyoxylase-like metal-dependent hydrolase (beta-lactamase superfamily II) [Sphingomonas sp. BE138]|uniref:MBL fold metallo-hydrolase n=1 Tax=Sphingomonas sp. BE138 TaxID=2817845 RepID=UPI00285BAABF|nr:MBL fold metallo-hydrolase [Sphingomonas sp. BE138]MDR6788554.1 glyoxylase-like metal-dependent hydrolase (beta-lactamase superfamily II) [Sphingomonas sp. BE138]